MRRRTGPGVTPGPRAAPGGLLAGFTLTEAPAVPAPPRPSPIDSSEPMRLSVIGYVACCSLK
jgi:hypothetical protein